MRGILFIIVCLLSLPTQAVTIPGVTTPTSTNAQTTAAKEPDIEQLTVHWPMCWKMTPRVRS